MSSEFDSNPSGSTSPTPGRLAALAERVGPSWGVIQRHPFFAGLSALGFFALALVLSFYWITGAVVHNRKNVVVPNLVGKNLEGALDLLTPLKLTLIKEGVQVDESLPAGAILRQTPPAGLTVREWRPVRVTLSSGGQVLFVPELVGVTLTEAQNRLRAAGLALGAMSQSYSTQKGDGLVMDQTPPPGGVIKPGAMVDLTVSKGVPPAGLRLMPRFVDRPVNLARTWAKDNGIDALVTEELSDGFPGLVLRQEPGPDTELAGNASVKFVVAKSTTVAVADVKTIRYELPAGTERALVRLVLRDDNGEKEIYNASTEGQPVEVNAAPQGAARVRIFVDGVLVEERPL